MVEPRVDSARVALERDKATHRVVLIAVLVVCAVYLAVLGPRDWIPHDDGAMAHAAERVLGGEVPHRDFNEPYTGGLTFFHAAAMKVFGVKLISLRFALLGFALLFLAAQYRLAARVAPPLIAGVATLIAFAWSLPNYFVPMPSWYNLFFATFGTLALFRYIERPSRRWLVVAGAMGGLSILCKIVGLYYFAAVFLVLVFLEIQAIGTTESPETPERPFALVCIIGLLVFVAVVVVLVSSRFTPLSFLLFVVPPACVSIYLGMRALRLKDHEAGVALGSLVRNVLLVSAAGAGVVIAYATVHVATGSFEDFWAGTVTVVLQRLDFTGAPLPGFATTVAAVPFAALFWLPAAGVRVPESRLWLAALGLIGTVGLVYAGAPDLYDGVWYAVRPLIPILVIAAWGTLARCAENLPPAHAAYLFVLASMASLLGLVQFPFSGGVYFCYVAPVIVLLVLFVSRLTEGFPVRTLAVVAAVMSGFAFVWLHSGSTYLLGYRYQRVHANVELDVERGEILVREYDALLYKELVARIQKHTRPDDYIYAAPDLPQVYFLSARKNPTRTFFDSTALDYHDVAAVDARILEQLEARDIAFAVLGGRSEFSRPPSAAVVRYLEERLPNEERMAGYMLRWRGNTLPGGN